MAGNERGPVLAVGILTCRRRAMRLRPNPQTEAASRTVVKRCGSKFESPVDRVEVQLDHHRSVIGKEL